MNATANEPSPSTTAIGRLRATAHEAYSEAELSAVGGREIKDLLDLALARLDILATGEDAKREQLQGQQPPAAAGSDSPAAFSEFKTALSAEDPVVAAMGAAQIAKWAEDQGMLKIAAFYAELAASWNPEDAMLAYSAGRLFRRLSDLAAAERWYNWAISKGTEAEHWLAVGLAWSGLGNVQRQRNRRAEAREAHAESLLVALRHSIRTLEGDAYHNLAVIAFEEGNSDEGVSHARKALDGYTDRRQRLLALANDLAWVWMTHDGAFSRSLPIFQKVLQRIEAPAYQLIVLGNVARAAGGAGNREEFERARRKLDELLCTVDWGESHSAALIELAHGACSLGEFRIAEKAAACALETALQRNETAVAAEASAMHEQARAHIRVQNAIRPRSRIEQKQLDELALELIQAIH